MKNYLVLIRRADFTDMFKYGQWFVNVNATREFSCSPEELGNHPEFLESLFTDANSFESSFTYLVIHFAKEDDVAVNPINIEEVQHIYPLDVEARKEFDISFDRHIRIEQPIWKDAFLRIQKNSLKADCLKGASNVWKLFGIKSDIEECKKIITDEQLESLIDQMFSNQRPFGDLPIWVYLMRYERHNFYPQETIGYYMDAVQVFCSFLQKREMIDDISNTTIYGVLSQMGRMKNDEIRRNLAASRDAARFLEIIANDIPEIDYLGVAVYFLYLRKITSESFSIPEFIKKKGGVFSKELSLASYMLGLVLGHSKTYDCLYESLPLSIYKSKDEMRDLDQKEYYARLRAEAEMKEMEEAERAKRETRKTRKDGRSGYDFQTKNSHLYDDSGQYKARKYGRASKQQEERGLQKRPGTFPYDSSKTYQMDSEKLDVETIIEPSLNNSQTILDHPELHGKASSQPIEGEPIRTIGEDLSLFDVPLNMSLKMGKIKKDGTIASRPAPVVVYTQGEYEHKIKEGWKVIDE